MEKGFLESYVESYVDTHNLFLSRRVDYAEIESLSECELQNSAVVQCIEQASDELDAYVEGQSIGVAGSYNCDGMLFDFDISLLEKDGLLANAALLHMRGVYLSSEYASYRNALLDAGPFSSVLYSYPDVSLARILSLNLDNEALVIHSDHGCFFPIYVKQSNGAELLDLSVYGSKPSWRTISLKNGLLTVQKDDSFQDIELNVQYELETAIDFFMGCMRF